MNIENGDYLTLSDGIKYIVVSSVYYNEKSYYCLMDINNPEKLCFCYEDGSELVVMSDKELNTDLLKLLYSEGKK